VHRDACARLARCISASRRRRHQGAGRDAGARAARGGPLAAVARLRSAAPVEVSGENPVAGEIPVIGEDTMIRYARFDTVLGPVYAAEEDGALFGLWFVG